MKIPHAVPLSLLTLFLVTTPALADEVMEHKAAAMDYDMDKGMEMGKASFLNPDTIQWGDAPPTLPKGAMSAVLYGDPSKPGPFVIRLKMPAGYKIPPHWHTMAENLTVISGTLYFGMGDTLDMKAAHELKTGGFHNTAAQVHHYAFSKNGAVVQIHGDGPFNITYINPADNPNPNAKK